MGDDIGFEPLYTGDEPLELDETLTPIERVKLCLRSELPFRRQWAATQLCVACVDADPEQTGEVLEDAFVSKDPVVRGTLATQIAELAVVYAKAQRTDGVVEGLVRMEDPLLSDEDAEVRMAACEAVTMMANAFDAARVESELFPLIEQLCKHEAIACRVTAANLIAQFAAQVDPSVVAVRCCQLVSQLCDDQLRDVRNAACVCMGIVMEKLETHAAVLVDVAQRMVRDQETSVRATAVTTLPSAALIAYKLNATDVLRSLSELFDEARSDRAEEVRSASILCTGRFIACGGPSVATSQLVSLYVKQASADDHVDAAFCFPGVALALGANRWNEIENLFNELVHDHRASVRLPLASSLHLLAKMMGPDNASARLQIAFHVLLEDVDEFVRKAMLSHFADYISELPPAAYSTYVDTACDICSTAQILWRPRKILAKQLPKLAKLMGSAVGSIVETLLTDKVAAVRAKTHIAVAEILATSMVDLFPLVSSLATSTSFAHHLIFVQQCEAVQNSAVALQLLPLLLSLALDPVPNVRHAIHRVLTKWSQMSEIGSRSDVQSTLSAVDVDRR